MLRGTIILGGLGAGGLSMWMVSKLFNTFKELKRSNYELDNANGATGTVYLRIPQRGRSNSDYVPRCNEDNGCNFSGWCRNSYWNIIQVVDNVADTLGLEFKSNVEDVKE